MVMKSSIYKNKKIWKHIKNNIDNYTSPEIPFSYAKNITIHYGDTILKIKNKKDFNDQVADIMFKTNFDHGSVKIRFKIDYSKLIDRVEKKANKLLSIDK